MWFICGITIASLHSAKDISNAVLSPISTGHFRGLEPVIFADQPFQVNETQDKTHDGQERTLSCPYTG